MAEPKDQGFALKLPEGVSAEGPVMDMTEAYVKAIIAIPAMMQEMCAILAEMTDHLSVLSLYVEKKGKDEGLIGPDELENDGDKDDTDEPKAG